MELPRAAIAAGLAVFTVGATTPALAIVVGSGDPGDYLDLAKLYPSVGQFHGTDANGQFAASGVVIAPNWVLTAAHVVAGAASLNFYLDDGGSWSSFTDGSRSGIAALDWQYYPKYDGNLGSGYDIALVRFDIDLTGDGLFSPAVMYSGSGEPGSVGTMVGFGMTGTGDSGATSFDGLKRAGENMVDAIALTPGKDNRILLADFDSGLSVDNSYGSATPLGMEAMIAPGDSGGGLFIPCDLSDFGCLAGITSFGWGRIDGIPDSDFGDVGGFTRVSSFVSWIEGVIAPASGDGGKGGGKGGGPKPRSASQLQAMAVEAPEPAALGLFALGLAALAAQRRRRQA